MIRIQRNPLRLFYLMSLVCVAIGGCASLGTSKYHTVDNLSKERTGRHTEVVADFERRRDNALFQAARSRYQTGDLSGCKTSIEKLLKRNPGHREALLFAIELNLLHGDSAAAIHFAQQAQHHHPQDKAVQQVVLMLQETLNDDNYGVSQAASGTENDIISTSFDEPAQRPSVRNLEGYATLDTEPEYGSVNVSDQSSLESPFPTTSAEFAVPAAESGHAYVSDRTGSQHASDGLAEQLRRVKIAMTEDDLDRAVQMISSALSRYPNEAALYRYLALAKYRMSDYKSAKVAIRQALSLDNSNALSYFLMGTIFAKQGQPNAAANSFEHAAKLDSKYSVWK